MSALYEAQRRLNGHDASIASVALAIEALERLLVARGHLKEGELMETLHRLVKEKNANQRQPSGGERSSPHLKSPGSSHCEGSTSASAH